MTRLLCRRPLTAALLATSIASNAAYAQQADEPKEKTSAVESTEIGEITVTAQRRVQNIQKVGVAISAIGADGLASLGRQDISAITNQIPSVQANTYSATQVVFNIRGVSQNDFADSQEGPVAFYNDEVYVASLGAISGQNFDLERVETLRGPQGSLFGRNATGGLVQVFTAKPSRELEGFGTLTVGSYGQISTEAAISGPVNDSVRARLSISTNHNDGYLSNDQGRDKGYTNFYAGRLQLAADVGPSTTLLVKGQLLRNANDSAGLYGHTTTIQNEFGVGAPVGPNDNPYGTCNGCDLFGYKDANDDIYVSNTNRLGVFDRTYYSATARLTHDFGFATLASITDYQNLKKLYQDDGDGSPNDIFTYDSRQQLEQWSEELRLSGETSGINWTVGGYLFRLKTANQYVADFPLFFDRLDYYTDIRTQSEAVFGQVEYPFSNVFSAIVGARYSWERKTLDYGVSDNGVLNTVVNRITHPEISSKTFNNYSGKVELDFKPSNSALFYVSANRGTKAGGFGTLGYVPPDIDRINYGEEILTNYEGGFKLTLFDRKLHFNGSIFHYDYDGYQAYSVIGTTQFITNKDARIDGVELQIDGRVSDALTFSLFGTYLDAKVRDIAMPTGERLSRRMPQAPKWSFGGMARYEWNVGSNEMALQTDWKWNSTQYFDTFNSPISLQKDYAIGNIRAEFKPSKAPFDIAVFVQNVTDQKYLVYSTDLSFISLAQHVFARPRWVGASITFKLR